MNKLIWIIIAIVLIALGFFLFSGSSDDTSSASTPEGSDPQETSALDEVQEEEFTDLDTSDQVFDEIEEALDLI